MKHILSDREIYEICYTTAFEGSRFAPWFSNHLWLMVNFGLRVGETLLTSGMIKTVDGDLLLTMPKTGHVRTLKKCRFLDDFDHVSHMARNQGVGFNKKALERIIKRFIPYRNLQCGDKGINTHLFRHNYAHGLYARLQDYSAVNEHLQEKTLSICKDYCTSQIYYLTN